MAQISTTKAIQLETWRRRVVVKGFIFQAGNWLMAECLHWQEFHTIWHSQNLSFVRFKLLLTLYKTFFGTVSVMSSSLGFPDAILFHRL